MNGIQKIRKLVKKIIGALMIFVFGISCISAVLCFVLSLSGQIEFPSIVEQIFFVLIYPVFFLVFLMLTGLGWCFWRDIPVQGFFRKLFVGMKGKYTEKKEVGYQEFSVLDAEQRKKLKPFLQEDPNPFAVYPIEKAYHDVLKNCSMAEKFYLVPDEVTAEKAIREYQKYLGWRKRYKKYSASAPKYVHIRVPFEKALTGCDDFYFKQCLKSGIHIVMHTGPYTLLDLTENNEYVVTVKTTDVSDDNKEICGEWTMHPVRK